MADHINKVVYGGKVLIDLTGDTVTAEKLMSGVTAHDKTGAIITGTCTYNADTSGATATADELLSGKTAFVGGQEVVGTMKNLGGVKGTISTKEQTYSIQAGYHDGSGSVSIDKTEKAKIIADNIRQGVTILGVVGTLEEGSGGDNKAQAKTVTPTSAQQVVTPDAGYKYLTQVTVEAIPYSEMDNEAGGKTATIGQAG